MGYLRNCYIKNRDGGDTMFNIHNGVVDATLDGYAIIPIEEYNLLTLGTHLSITDKPRANTEPKKRGYEFL